ncbi:hypothetical protein FNV43_RR27170 [Rhamnella rubrinervis]|uniref:Uncharacterized protein n=1 Tax=Rhamnella rubrinervis TaxID=2594499 RepID=A0A8K0GSA3_9ROSA|nr:hypothetical protein FNV43_RR27170 [Rhamnella rubrinervis]
MARYHLLPDLKPLAPTQVHRLLPKSPSVLRRNLFLTPFSFYVGSTFKGAPREQQALLELEETATRLKREKETLRNTLNYLTATSAMLGKDLLIGISDSGKLSFLSFCNEMHRSGSVKFLETYSLTCWKLRCVGHSVLYIWLETLRLGTKGGKAKNAEPADEVLKKAQALFLDRLSELVNASSLQKIHHFSLLVVGLEEKDKWSV